MQEGAVRPEAFFAHCTRTEQNANLMSLVGWPLAEDCTKARGNLLRKSQHAVFCFPQRSNIRCVRSSRHNFAKNK